MKPVLLLALSGMAIAAATPVMAQGDHYRATLSSAAGKSTLVTRDTVWRCTDSVCTAGKSGSRDAIVCELVAKRAGALAGFAVNGSEFDAEALGKCNAHAR